MIALVLNDGTTYTGLAGCKIVDVPDLYEEIGKFDEAVARLCAGNLQDDDAEVIYTFDGDERASPRFTDEERYLIEEGLNYTETNGAPGMVPAMRPETQRHANLRDSIEGKLR